MWVVTTPWGPKRIYVRNYSGPLGSIAHIHVCDRVRGKQPYVGGSYFAIWAKAVTSVSLVELHFFRLKHAVVIRESSYQLCNCQTLSFWLPQLCQRQASQTWPQLTAPRKKPKKRTLLGSRATLFMLVRCKSNARG